MKNIKRTALLFCGALGLATAAFAANHTTQGEGWDGGTTGTFWTLYKYNSTSGGVNVTDTTKRQATISFENPDRADTDFVGGVGWKDLIYPANVSYKVTNWTWQTTPAMDNRGVFGVYGWSCALSQQLSDKNVEFYIIDNWLGKNQYVPYYDGSRMVEKESIFANGAWYKIYQSGSLYRDNACAGSEQPFIQLWAVRQGKRSLIKSPGVGIANNVDFRTIGGALGRYGYMTYNMRYLVVGVDVFQAAKGYVSLDYVNKS